VLQFAQPSYSVQSGEEVKVEVVGENIPIMGEMNIELLVNPQLLEYIEADPGEVLHTGFDTNVDAEKGTIELSFKDVTGTGDSGKVVLGSVTLKGKSTGVSHLIFRAGTLQDIDGNVHSPTVHGSRVNID
jgi:hypothetical protein